MECAYGTPARDASSRRIPRGEGLLADLPFTVWREAGLGAPGPGTAGLEAAEHSRSMLVRTPGPVGRGAVG
jgi:hypothetical protein